MQKTKTRGCIEAGFVPYCFGELTVLRFILFLQSPSPKSIVSIQSHKRPLFFLIFPFEFAPFKFEFVFPLISDQDCFCKDVLAYDLIVMPDLDQAEEKMDEDLGVEAKSAAVREVAKILPLLEHLQSIATIEADYITRQQANYSRTHNLNYQVNDAQLSTMVAEQVIYRCV